MRGAPRLLLSGVTLLVSLLAVSPAVAAKKKVHTLTLTTSSVERSWTDEGATGRSVGDVFIMTAKLTGSGGVTGHFAMWCTIVDLERDGAVAGLCTSSTVIAGKGEITAAGTASLVPDTTGTSPFGVTIGPVEESAVTGGTGAYQGAHGQLTSTKTATGRTLRYRYWL